MLLPILSFKVTHKDPSIDLAVLGSGRDFRQLNCRSIPKGRRVSLTGYPEGSGQQVVSHGKTVRDKKSKYSAVEGFAMKGMSGGPVVQENEQLAGIFKSFRGTSRYWYVPGSKICKSLENLKGARLNNGLYVPPQPKDENLLVAENTLPAPQDHIDKTPERMAPKSAPVTMPVQKQVVQNQAVQNQTVRGLTAQNQYGQSVVSTSPRLSNSVLSGVAVVTSQTLPQAQLASLSAEPKIISVPNVTKPQEIKVVRVSGSIQNSSAQNVMIVAPKEQKLQRALSAQLAPVLETSFPHLKPNRSANVPEMMAERVLQKEPVPMNLLAKSSFNEDSLRLVDMTLFGQAKGVQVTSLSQDIHITVPKISLTAQQLQLANMASSFVAKAEPVIRRVQTGRRALPRDPLFWGSYWGQLALALFLGFTFGGSFMLWGGRLNRLLSRNRA